MAANDSTYCNFCRKSFSSLLESLKHEGDLDHCLNKIIFTNPQLSTASSSRSSSPASVSSVEDGFNTPKHDTLKRNYIKHEPINDVYTCSICNTFVTGFVPLEQHLMGIKHQKKLKNFKEHRDFDEINSRFEGLQISEIIDDEDNRVSNILNQIEPGNAKSAVEETLKNKYATYDGDNVFRCLVCETFVTGYVPFVQHVTGSKHQKKLKAMIESAKMEEINERFEAKNLSAIFNEAKEEEEEENELQVVRTSPEIRLPLVSPKPQADVTFPFVCVPCSKKFTGEEPFLQHLSSALHLKKLKKLVVQVKSSTNDSFPVPTASTPLTSTPTKSSSPNLDEMSMNGSDPNFPYVCLPCAKKFTGEEPYRQHLDSVVHQKKVQLGSSGSSSQVFSCRYCQITFSGPIPYQDHMESPKHEKQMRKIQLFGNTMPDVDSSGVGSSSSGTGSGVVTPEEVHWERLRDSTKIEGTYRASDIRCIKANEPIRL